MLLLRKAHVRAYDRIDPETGIRIHVKEHEDKRPSARQAPLRADVAAVRLQRQFQGMSELGQKLRAERGASAERPSADRERRPTVERRREPSPPVEEDHSKEPPPIVQQMVGRIQAGETPEEIHKAITGGASIAPLVSFDLWLAAIGHPLAQHKGTVYQRLGAFLQEAKGKVEQRTQAKQQTTQAAAKDTRSPAAKQEAISTHREQQEEVRGQQQQSFVDTLEGVSDGTRFTLPTGPRGMTGSWKKETIGGEAYWKKGSQYKPSTAFLGWAAQISKQLDEGPTQPARQKKDRSVLGLRVKKPVTTEAQPVGEGGYLASLPAEQVGKAARTFTDRGERIDIRYAVVEADRLNSSHDENFATNPDFPAELQPRDRRSMASVVQVQEMIAGFTPDLMGANVKTSEGAPMLGDEEGAVEIGNGRSIALKKIYATPEYAEERDAYKNWLQEEAGSFGLDANSVAGMNKPILVRVRTTPVNREQFVGITNKPAQSGYAPAAQAKNDAANIGPEMLKLYNPRFEAGVAAEGNNAFVRAFMGTLEPSEAAMLTQDDGEVGPVGIKRIQDALLYAAYENTALVKRVTEETDAQTKTVSNALVALAPRVALLKHESPDFDISKDLAAAANALVDAKKRGLSVEDYLSQVKIGGEELNPEGQELLRIFDSHSRSATKLRQFLSIYLDIGATQGGMFASSESIDKMQAIHRAGERVNREAVVKSRLVLMKGKSQIAYRTRWHGLPIDVETPDGKYRHWHDPAVHVDGKTRMEAFDYGAVHGVKGLDDDDLDIFLGPAAHIDAPFVYLIRIMKPPEFTEEDETKVIANVRSQNEAVAVMLLHYSDPRFIGPIREMRVQEFREKMKEYQGAVFDEALLDAA